MTQPVVRPQFTPLPCDTNTSAEYAPLRTSCSGRTEIWTPIIRCPAPFTTEFFENAVDQLVHHPEYNSTLILRSETLSDVRFSEDDGPAREQEDAETMLLKALTHCDLEGYRPVRAIRRRLLPRRPGRDASLEQTCVFYTATVTSTEVGKVHALEGEHTTTPMYEDEQDSATSLLILTPLLKDGESLPYYHPAVRRLAVRYVQNIQEPCSESETTTLASGMLLIEAVLPPSGPTPPHPPDSNSRLYRTCLALLDTVHRYGWGALTHYRKRVHHDTLVPRETYQDLYLVLRERYKHLVSQWKEATDPAKHVFEDVGIATFLMLFWKATYGTRRDGSVEPDADHGGGADTNMMPCRNWPRPAGGFLDLGCGNGLLVHILVSEGYVGHGIDVRARQSWSHYPEATRKALHVYSLDPTGYIHHPRTESAGSSGNLKSSDDTKNDTGTDFFKPGVFLIGNHADELTPWVPVLATLCDAVGYLSIPCCAWGFDERFARSSTATSSLLSFYCRSSLYDPSTINLEGDMDDESAFIETLNLGAEGTRKSQYSVYRIWLARLSRWMGWKVECEVLRIPSTRNWGVVGRERLHVGGDEDGELFKERAREIVREVVRRGVFKTRKPEGKAGDH
ncbi:hypothetical protein F5J12DRAFT_957073 [Pisolithus orientalis]|uniref:uncharacterized protein n=1 Tax=Pisolithus orientalis TaxID=936130 RepID=UPI00222509D5|nr:uncharacterized protein F5J12DRAFT_957073 [Pisolithus orientalis]KAI5997267.1 hypothetical protein F5J12DRAFT_957073 [Pisolithus orientalis]